MTKERESTKKKQNKDAKIKFSIKKKLFYALLPIVICIISIILILVYQNTSKIILEKSENLLVTSTESVVNKVEAWMKETITALEEQRDTLEYFSMDDKHELDYIKHTENQYDAYPAGIYIGTKQGTLIHASFVPGSDYNIFEKPWYTEGITSEKFIFGSVYYDENSQAYVVGASGMLKDKKGKVRGVAAADVYLSPISDIVKKITLEQTGGIFLLDTKTDTIIGHKEAAIVGTNLSDQTDEMYEYIKEIIHNRIEGLQIYQQLDGSKTYIDITKVPDSDWAAIAYVPHKEIMEDLNILSKNIIFITIIGIILLVILIERIIHIIIKPMKTLTSVLVTITNGNFSTGVNVYTKDEVGLMAFNLNHFIETMRGIISRITDISGKISLQSDSSAKIADNLSKSADLQAKSMNEMDITMDELAHSVSDVAENANSLSEFVSGVREQGEKTSEQMIQTVTEIKEGKTDMGHVVQAMSEISQKGTMLERSVQEVGSSITEINSMVELIRNIAEETNLLSLNAAIEAARAGDAGKGFAVVAEQIKTLADTSTNAIDNISSLTQKIYFLVEDIVQKTSESVIAINESKKIVNKTEKTFETIFGTITITDKVIGDITTKIEEVNDIATSVASITQQQMAASQEILATVENLNENAKSVSTNSKVVATGAEELAVSAQELQKDMKNFIV